MTPENYTYLDLRRRVARAIEYQMALAARDAKKAAEVVRLHQAETAAGKDPACA